MVSIQRRYLVFITSGGHIPNNKNPRGLLPTMASTGSPAMSSTQGVLKHTIRGFGSQSER